ncbi:RNA-guided endonuclease InsQ/TnpB family protein [Streptomyces natalensis]|uniref:RNA-guided endonuclease InsQ/TnpB family protein n=1 Tax=Streptomyces natalensis TaxID=68242 RepID=UPI00099BBFFD|nr:RNA-guided endonuclease TnpB family protein [Streptomyces natalensis]
MKADMGRKYRAYPTPEQDEILTRWGHHARALWNLALEHRMMVRRKHDGRSWVWSAEQCVLLTEIRNDPDESINWIRDLPASAAQQVLRQMDEAFKRIANPKLRARNPKFKRRNCGAHLTFPAQRLKVRKLNRHWASVRIPKLGWLRFRLSRALGGTVRSCTLSRNGLGWHVAFGVHTGAKSAPPNGKPGCGVDFGVHVSAWVSTETAPRLMPSSLTDGEQQRLRTLERRKARQLTYAKKQNGGTYSNRLRKTIAQIAALKARQARRRLDFTHKLTTDLAKNHGFVGIEDLRVLNMTKSAKGTVAAPGRGVGRKSGLNRAIYDHIPGERRRQLAYKAPMYGSQLRPVAPHGTSQTCPECGKRDPRSRVGCGREFACVHCGHTDHADKTASIEIEARARRMGDTVTKSTRSPARGARGRETVTRLRAAPATHVA